ncbi:MAG: response regulator [Nitrospirae bacterium]|nr:response regulator [Nitrospirota bacterium]
MSEKKTVLIIDDDKSVREFLHDLLRLSGFKSYSADNGISALSLLKKRHFDIIITDCSMPGMNGIELVKIISPQYPHTLIIGMSGNCDEKDFLSAGANAFLAKPFRPDDLLLLFQAKH